VATLRSSISSMILPLCLISLCGGPAVRGTPPEDHAATKLRLPGWIESEADAEIPPPIVRTSGEARPAAAPSGLRRWMSERFAALPGGAPAVKDEPTRPQQPVTSASPTVTRAGPTVTAPIAETPDEMPTLSIDPASFRGALPGRTTRQELEAAWGPGTPSDEDADTASWKFDPFERVEVTFAGDTVAAIGIKLASPMPIPDLAQQLEIADLRTVPITDEDGREIGDVFPERGVILSVEPGTRQATAILIEPLDPDAFVLRAEQELESRSAYAVADLQYAIEIDPAHVQAQRLLLNLATQQGKWTQALRRAETASRPDPEDPWIRLKHARVLLALDRAAEARDLIGDVQGGGDLPPLIAAQCQRLLGRAALAGPAADHRAAVEHFTEAIRLAAPLLVKKSPAVQAATREILLDAHMGTALAIAAGTWQQKSRVIPKWVVRGEAVAQELNGSDFERQILELQLCRGALAVAAASNESFDHLPWVKRMLELRDRMGETIADPWRRRQIDWEVGQGLADALTAAQIRSDTSDMLDNATLTAAYLERGSDRRELTSKERKQLGDLHFRIGILHSLQRGDHATAVTWFDRTIPLWDANERFEADGEFGRLGESYVSMAISYWQVDRRDDALELGRRGVDLMVTAVDAGRLEERALAVAYGNLATMYAEQGDEDRSRSYAEMASRAEAAGSVVR
jgi:tetratricopeptide (TPR) repeat protein